LGTWFRAMWPNVRCLLKEPCDQMGIPNAKSVVSPRDNMLPQNPPNVKIESLSVTPPGVYRMVW
jgi:hypothetical protein